MHSLKNFMIFFLLLVLSSLSFGVHAADPSYRYHYCFNTTSFTINSTYQTSLNTLLSSLSNASRTKGFSSGFYNTTARRDPDDVYGLFLCRGDVSSSTCRDCVNFATKDVTQRCPVEKEVVIWYDECLLRYSNVSFFSVMDEAPRIWLWNTQNSTESSRFNEEVAKLMDETTIEALDSPRNFATRHKNFTAFQTLYGLAQCTPDLTKSDCNRCLRGAIAIFPNCCSGKLGGRVLYPSCNVRYEVYPFYIEKLAAAPPPLLLSPPPPSREGRRRISSSTIIAIVVPVAFFVVFSIACCCFLRRRAKKKYKSVPEGNGDDITSVKSLQFDFGTIQVAKKQFSADNKLGEGGFGEVYKGTLPNGQEIAVKRLSRSSGQGAQEFKNEVVLVAKLQHRNLVRLLGFCLQGGEKILVYEFVTNKSLDYFLFDPEKQGQVNWSRRYKIIEGIARGLLYLHEDSPLRIIHRDLKASNVLLDADMNSKISDFGMARIFGVDQTQGSTNRVVGTFGYMAPEYAIRGHFSVKSDVYSFGVLVLEIITGKKINNFYETHGASDLMSYAWKHWRAGTPLELLDPTLSKDGYSRNEVIRCAQVALLCVQEDPAARLTMKTILLTLSSHSVTLPPPGEPAFFFGSKSDQSIPKMGMKFSRSTSKSIPLSVDQASITEVYPR